MRTKRQSVQYIEKCCNIVILLMKNGDQHCFGFVNAYQSPNKEVKIFQSGINAGQSILVHSIVKYGLIRSPAKEIMDLN